MNPKFFGRLFLFVAGVAGLVLLTAAILVTPALVAYGACCGG